MEKPWINVIGGGLAGTELAYQLGSRGIGVRLFEMRPVKMTPAHQTGNLAELVCSNSFKSTAEHSAHGALKREMESLGSIILQAAAAARVPAGEALAVDREVFSKCVEQALLQTRNVEKYSSQVEDLDALPPAHCSVVATGPLTQGPLAAQIASLSSQRGLYFYDAIAPVVSADSIQRAVAFGATRYGHGEADYLNCPMTSEEYQVFYDALLSAKKVAFQDFEQAQYFQGCQPIEAIAETGRDSLRFGPMKPVGLIDPRTGRRPHAVVQLRIDNLSQTAYNMVGFQTKLIYQEQKRVFSLIPGLENAEFLRLGSMHRNTYICTPELLSSNFALHARPQVRFAGQITGVEGYTESAAVGLLVGLSIALELGAIPGGSGKKWIVPPRASALGSLCHYLFHSPPAEFQPVQVHFGLLPDNGAREKYADKRKHRADLCRRGLVELVRWKEDFGF